MMDENVQLLPRDILYSSSTAENYASFISIFMCKLNGNGRERTAARARGPLHIAARTDARARAVARV